MKLSEASKKLKIKSRSAAKIKWGVAGCGSITEKTFIPAIQMLKKNRLISVYSSDLPRAKFIADKFAVQNAFNNFDEFLKSDIDVVYVASKNSDHYWQVMKAAEAGKHILCEKPMAMSSKEALEMVKYCEANGVKLAINYVYRFHPLIIKAKELIRNELIGKIISISINYNIKLPPSENFRYKKEMSGGGAFRDLGTHVLDLMRYFGGTIEDVTGYYDNVIYTSEVEDFAAGVVRFEKSGYGTFNVSYNSEKAFNRIEIIGYKGNIAIENVMVKKHSPSKLIIDLIGENKKAFRKRTPKMIPLLKEFQKSLLNDIQPKPSGQDGLINMELMEKFEKQCKKRKSKSR